MPIKPITFFFQSLCYFRITIYCHLNGMLIFGAVHGEQIDVMFKNIVSKQMFFSFYIIFIRFKIAYGFWKLLFCCCQRSSTLLMNLFNAVCLTEAQCLCIFTHRNTEISRLNLIKIECWKSGAAQMIHTDQIRAVCLFNVTGLTHSTFWNIIYIESCLSLPLECRVLCLVSPLPWADT